MTTRKQQQIWSDEHSKVRDLPAMASPSPARGVVEFCEYVRDQLPGGNLRAIDIGCGKGRNTLYLARLGFETHAIDYIELATTTLQDRAGIEGLLDKITVHVQPIDVTWPFENDFFDIAIDNFSSIDVETEKGRMVYRDEMFRTLKPGGFAFVAVVAAYDEVESEIMQTTPGSEKHSTVWPNSGKFQKNYDQTEIAEFYRNFELVNLKEVRTSAVKLNRNYTATDLWVWLRKSE